MKKILVALLFLYFPLAWSMIDDPANFIEFKGDETDVRYTEAETFCNKNANNIVIIIDDTPIIIKILRFQLKKLGIKAVCFYSGNVFLDALEKQRIPSLLTSAIGVIIDKEMPGKNGLQVADAVIEHKYFTIKNNSSEKDGLPLILNSSSSLKDSEIDKVVNFTKVLSEKNCMREIEQEISPRGDR